MCRDRGSCSSVGPHKRQECVKCALWTAECNGDLIVSVVPVITCEQRKGIHRVRPFHLCICSLQCLIITYMSPERHLLCSWQSKQKWDVRSLLWPCSFEGIHLEYIWTWHQSRHLKCRGAIFYLISFLLLILLHAFSMLILNPVMLRTVIS